MLRPNNLVSLHELNTEGIALEICSLCFNCPVREDDLIKFCFPY